MSEKIPLSAPITNWLFISIAITIFTSCNKMPTTIFDADKTYVETDLIPIKELLPQL